MQKFNNFITIIANEKEKKPTKKKWQAILKIKLPKFLRLYC